MITVMVAYRDVSLRGLLHRLGFLHLNIVHDAQLLDRRHRPTDARLARLARTNRLCLFRFRLPLQLQLQLSLLLTKQRGLLSGKTKPGWILNER